MRFLALFASIFFAIVALAFMFGGYEPSKAEVVIWLILLAVTSFIDYMELRDIENSRKNTSRKGRAK